VHQPRRGAAALEFAVVGTGLFIIIFGIIELSRGLMVQHLLTNAARQGCRVGCISGKSNTDVTNAVNVALSSQGISTDTIQVQVNDGTGDVLNAKSGDEVTVLVSVPIATASWFPGTRFLSGTLKGRYTLRRE
jgi:Flp pilus assembly protein TadG